ncbi:MAG: lipopolysaccharide biosynthesis protein [Mucilaginibacter sp.]|uniref:lipopolysaccharide biosynthesis protein n=1 Tax=Mucilaginibacter sp. TaxID=1882438 RepID=UPI0031A7EFD5
MTGISLKIKGFFSSGHERTLKAKKNIAISFLLRGISIATGFILIPMTINYVDSTQYGMWLTLSSVITWFNFFDVGLGNGLKNKLAEANALEDYTSARIYVSTTYAILGIISIILLIGFNIANKYINWGAILNTKTSDPNGLNLLALVLICIFCVQFFVQLIQVVLIANHEPSKVSLINVLSQIGSCVIIFILAKTTKGSLLKLVFVLGGVPVFTQIAASIWFYATTYRKYLPSIKLVNFKFAKSLLGVGGIFFFIQIGALILFQTDNIVIAQLFGPKEVTVFNIAYKLFSSITMVFTIIVTPLWSAFTDANTKGDTAWMRRTLKRMRLYWAVLSGVAIVLLLLSPFIYNIWLHHKVEVPFFVSFVMAFQAIIYCWQTMHVFFLNGVGKIRLQLYLVIVGTVINIPLAIFFSKYIGISGVTLSNIVVYLILGIFFAIQSNKILNGSTSKIWNQ